MTFQGSFTDSRGPVISTATITGLRGRTFQVAAASASTAWPNANDAYLIPFTLAGPYTIKEMFWFSGTTPGTTNFDLGIYRDDFTLIKAIGATAATNTTDIIEPPGAAAFSTPVTLTRGRYYMAMSSASAALTVRAQVQANGWPRALGMQKMATAHPLPATITPASMSTTAFVPWIGMTTITNILG